MSAMDRISELPTEILHQILSLLPTKIAARTAVLSKLWLKACSTNPNLNFDESDFGRHDQFVRAVDITLERYLHENLPISAFKLCISFSYQTDCEGLVDKWLGILAEKRVSHVTLFVKGISRHFSERYSLSADTIFAMESLQHLELNQCKILPKQKTLLLEDSTIKCRNLKSLSLCYVSVSESTLDRLISWCSPHIMTISLQCCFGFSGIRFSNMPKLSSLSILCCPIEEVDVVGAPNLLSFEYVNKDKSEFSNGKIINLCSLNIATCHNLRRLEFVKTTIFDEGALFQLIKKLPFIKELSLRCCEYLKNIKISSSTLEVCSIVGCNSLLQAIFDVPKLLSLSFSNQYRLPSFSFGSASSQCRVSINSVCLVDVDQFMHFRRSLIELNNLSVDLTFGITTSLNHIPKRLRAASGVDHLPAPEVESLILSDHEYYSSVLSYSTYFDDLFWACSPKCLTVIQCSQGFRKYLRRQLLKKWHWRLTKCTWKEYLSNAEIEYQKKIGDDWVTLDRKMLAATPHIIEEIQTIRFKKTQEKREK